MAEEEHVESGGVAKTFVFLIGLFVVLGALWVARGGPTAGNIQPGIFITPPSPVQTNETYVPSTGPTSEYQEQSPYQNPVQPPDQYQAQPPYDPEYQYPTEPHTATPNLY